MIDLVGYLGSACLVASYLPQVVLLVRGRYDTRAVSLGMFLLQLTGGLFFVTHSALLRNLPVLVAASANTLLRVMVIVTLVRDRMRRRRAAQAKVTWRDVRVKVRGPPRETEQPCRASR